MGQTDSIRDVARSRQPLSAWFGVVLLFFLFGVVVFAVIGPSPRTDTYEQTRAKNRAEKLKTIHDEATKALTGYAWIDKNKGTVRVPIERAMELTVAELKDKKPGPGGPIVVAGAAGAAPQATPAATASPSPSGRRGKSSSPSASGTPKATSVEGPNSENRGQPAAAANPPAAKPGTQPGANATPAASPAATPAVSPSPNAAPSTAGSPLPVRGKESPSPSPR